MKPEEWRTILEAPRYCVSSYGRVWSNITQKFLSPGLAGKGYPFVGLMGLNGRIQRYVHVLVAEAFLPPRPSEFHEVNHKDGIKTNNHVGNLEWNTRLENMRHASSQGLLNNVGAPKTRVRIIETGEIFESQHACARAIGGRQSTIHACLVGRLRDNTHMGYHFEYVD